MQAVIGIGIIIFGIIWVIDSIMKIWGGVGLW